MFVIFNKNKEKTYVFQQKQKNYVKI